MRPGEERLVTLSPSDGAATVLRPNPQPQHAIAPGTLLVNTYEVERLLGGGGMGEVYLAHHAGLGTRHAIKVIRPAMALDRQVMDLFYREAKVLRGVRHDAVVSYDGFVRDDQGRDYLVMEFVEGPSLAERLRRGPLAPEQVLALRDRLAAGLAEAHRKGAVHRDIAPDNVILPGDRIEAAKLIDFGLCKLTDPTQKTIIGSSFAGKYRYASPEQFGLFGGNLDARSDIYSLGLVLGSAAQGRPLLSEGSFADALHAREALPDLSGVPQSLREWLTAMLQPDPVLRPASLDALLERWPAGIRPNHTQPTAGHPGPIGGVNQAVHGARRWPAAVVVIALLGVAGGGLYWLLRPLPSPMDTTEHGLESPLEGPVAPGQDNQSTLGSDLPQDLGALVRTGQLDQAFLLAQTLFGSEQSVPTQDGWALVQALRAAGRLDQTFALARELATAGYGPAALLLAQMYDPGLWSPESSPFSRANPTKARDWYQRAAELGMPEADQGLQALDSMQESQ